MARPRGETRERIYRFVRERLLAGDPPTVREVQDAVGLRAVESARTHLERLVADGRLTKEPGLSRGYRLPAGAGGDLRAELVPLVGRVQAGGLTAAIEEPEGRLAVTRSSTDRSELFALRVAGESMRDAGILEGDVVIVRRSESSGGGAPQDGDIVVAQVGDEATVKTLRYVDTGGKAGTGGNIGTERRAKTTGRGKKRRRIELHPANPDFAPIIPDLSDLHTQGVEIRFEILGRVIEVRRSLDAANDLTTDVDWES